MKKVTKHRVNTTETEHLSLLEAAKLVRAAMREKAKKQGYDQLGIRVFTEPRKDGIRTKFWATRYNDIDTAAQVANKVLTANYGAKYKATAKNTKTYYGANSLSIFIKL